MVQVQLDCMQLCRWSMLTAGCKVHKAGELDTFDITMTNSIGKSLQCMMLQH